MSGLYCLIGDTTGQRITSGGLVVTHTNRAELEWLFPNLRVEPIRINPAETLPVQFMPGCEGITFPLDRRQFR
ncbi:hypothetical protein BJF83_20855 [Nocardiopsis sp. CNR-923]|uniref:hypothetical protein n=1 Tax=Nocardiopsis sp. CNR-923 TaxID=1904965 RepID=UPI000968D452|nr:hypothetical protein [Nocardiopsis sp. CNR-923]OLT26538.1 hypothetical protein BJF83_20855 [Nocardiopsis sp. CNR-923]